VAAATGHICEFNDLADDAADSGGSQLNLGDVVQTTPPRITYIRHSRC
jgi:hypothetical protein